MTSTDPAKALARNLSNLERRLNAVERGTQLAHSSLVVDGETVTVPQTIRTATTALQAANGKNTVTYSDSPPSGEGTTIDDIWYQMVDGVVGGVWRWTGEAWEPHTFGDEVLDSLTVGKLVAGEIAAGQRIIAGPTLGTHAEMAADGFRVFKDDPVDGIPNEVVRMGTETNDFIGVVSETGELLASIDDTGQGNFQSIYVTGDAFFEGKTLNTLISENGTGAVGFFEGYPPDTTGGGFFGPIRDRVGIIEANAMLQEGRRYVLRWKSAWAGSHAASECRYVITQTGPTEPGAGTAWPVLVTSPLVDTWIFQVANEHGWQTAIGETTFVPTATGRHRFLLCIERGASLPDMNVHVVAVFKNILTVDDTGPARPVTGAVSQGGGTLYQGPPPPPPPPPTQQYYVDLGPVGKASFRGDGSLRTDLGGLDIVQGWDPSGYNGDGQGQYWFDLPDITGTVDRVDLYLYTSHWYYNGGGTAILNIGDARGDFGPVRFRNNWYVGGYPKPGGKTVTLPGDWFPFFQGTNNSKYNGRASTIILGPGYGTDLTYYGRFADCRLRIWYTQ